MRNKLEQSCQKQSTNGKMQSVLLPLDKQILDRPDGHCPTVGIADRHGTSMGTSDRQCTVVGTSTGAAFLWVPDPAEQSSVRGEAET